MCILKYMNDEQISRANTVGVKSWKYHFTTVTTFSKTLSLVLFIILPLLGIWFGYSLSNTAKTSIKNSDYIQNENNLATDIIQTVNNDLFLSAYDQTNRNITFDTEGNRYTIFECALTKIDTNGTVLWTNDEACFRHVQVHAEKVYAYASYRNDNQTEMYAFNKESGEILWKADELVPYSYTIETIDGKDYVYVKDMHWLKCLDTEDGTEVWRLMDTDNNEIWTSDSVYKDGLFYVSERKGDSSNIYVVNALSGDIIDKKIIEQFDSVGLAAVNEYLIINANRDDTATSFIEILNTEDFSVVARIDDIKYIGSKTSYIVDENENFYVIFTYDPDYSLEEKIVSIRLSDGHINWESDYTFNTSRPLIHNNSQYLNEGKLYIIDFVFHPYDENIQERTYIIYTYDTQTGRLVDANISQFSDE
jgi:hypothetical protein